MPDEQLFAYELNLARHDPAAYAQATALPVDLSEVPARPPLAWNDSLATAAQTHAEAMAEHDNLTQRDPVTGHWPNRIAHDHGYALPETWSLDANNIQVIAASRILADADTTLETFILDESDPTHGSRNLLLGVDVFGLNREVGVGHAVNATTSRQHFWTVQAAWSDTLDRFLTGVVFADANGNNRYDLNEGLSGVLVSSGSFSATTNTAGGWSIKMPDGDYLVLASGGEFVGTATGRITVLGENVEVDFISGQKRPTVDFEPYQNRAPQPVDDTATVLEDGSVSAVVLANDADSDGTLAAGSVTITQLPAHGTAQVDTATGEIYYTPNNDFYGVDFLAYAVRDDEGALSNEAYLDLTVTAVNDAPQAVGDVTQTRERHKVMIPVLDNDTDVDSQLDGATLVVTHIPAHGTVEVDPIAGTITYLSAYQFTGQDSFTYTVRDEQGALSNEATVSITVEPRPPSPWRNASNPFDVDVDGSVVPLDVLVLINMLNLRGAFELPGELQAPPPYFDSNGDYFLTPLDALMIINYLNAQPSGEGEDAIQPFANAGQTEWSEYVVRGVWRPFATVIEPSFSFQQPLDDPSAGNSNQIISGINPGNWPQLVARAESSSLVIRRPTREVREATTALNSDEAVDLAMALGEDWLQFR